MDGKFFKDETKDGIVKVLDEATNVGVFEVVEKQAYRIVLNQIDKFADKHVPDSLDDAINATVIYALSGAYEAAAESAGRIIDDLVDIEKVSDDIEKLVFVDGLKFVVRQLQMYIENRKNKD